MPGASFFHTTFSNVKKLVQYILHLCRLSAIRGAVLPVADSISIKVFCMMFDLVLFCFNTLCLHGGMCALSAKHEM